MLLTSTSSLIRLVTSSTADVHVQANWADLTTTTFTPGSTNTIVTTATNTTIVASPAASTQRQIKGISLYNAHVSDSNTITVQHYDGTVYVTVFKITLAAGERAQYSGDQWPSSSTGTGITDGDKGDITVSSSGGVWTIDNSAVTYAKIQDVSDTNKLLGRSTAGAGVIEEIPCTAAGRNLLDDADASAQRSTLGLGTLATQNGTFSGTSSGTNTGDQTITLTGDVTGSGTGSFAATIATPASATVANDDKVLIKDTSASDATKYVTTQSIADLPASSKVSFRAYAGSNLSVSDNTATKVHIDTETFDSHGYFDSTTNYRFTPLVAGTYCVMAAGRYTTIPDQSPVSVRIYKNGTNVSQTNIPISGTAPQGASVLALIEMNGSTDYLEMYTLQISGSTQTLQGITETTFFAAFLIN